MFLKKSLSAYDVVEALEGPACLFSGDGTPLYQNVTFKSLLENGSLSFTELPDLTSLERALHALMPSNGPQEFHLNGDLYRYTLRSFPEGFLLQLVSLQHLGSIRRTGASLNYIPWGILTCDVSGPSTKVIFSNDPASRYLEMLSGSMTGQNAQDIFRIFGIPANLESHLRGEKNSFYDYERKTDRKTMWYRFHFIPFQYDNPYCLVVIEDTTEEKIREGQFFQAQRLEALGQLAGGVAHDFNNILSIIDGYARLGKKSLDKPDEARNCYDRIMQSVERASSITTHLLTFGSHKVIRQSVCDLGELLRDQEGMLRPLLDATIILAIKVEDGLYIETPEADVCQMLLNLCINSRDAMPDGGHLLIESGRQDESFVFMRVIDTGAGMPPEVRARIFDPFFTTKDQGKGTGLGLSMVYGMVKDLGGEIEVVSKPGEGTSITILFPASDERPESESVTSDDINTISLSGRTVLIAEDEPDLLDLLSLMLSGMGIKVLQARNGNEALMVQDDYEGIIDFLITDVVMPEVNGVKLAELFSAVRPATKILFMSGYPANGQMNRVPLPEGAILLPKPVQPETIMYVLKSMLVENPETSAQASGSHGRWRTA